MTTFRYCCSYMQEIKRITGREYRPFDYYGQKMRNMWLWQWVPFAIPLMKPLTTLWRRRKGSSVRVHLYRPFSEKYFFDVIPKTVKKIAVLDRTKEPEHRESLCTLMFQKCICQRKQAGYRRRKIWTRFEGYQTVPNHISIWEFEAGWAEKQLYNWNCRWCDQFVSSGRDIIETTPQGQ